MSNLQSARDAILAELEHARAGADYYQSRVRALEATLDQLETLSAGERKPAKRAYTKRVARDSSAPKKTKAGNEGLSVKRAAKPLPKTGRAFFKGLLSEVPKSLGELTEAAAAALKITPSGNDLKKLTNRLAVALASMTKASEIKDSGSGRNRRFFL